METYAVHHLRTAEHSGDSFSRDWMLWNPHHKQDWDEHLKTPTNPAVESFHKTLPDYNETELHSLAAVAEELGLAHVLLKDESTRFGLPAFKILGASWACHRAICQRLHLSTTTNLIQVRKALELTSPENEIRLVTCSEGNWGRACARMARIFGLPCTIYVSGLMSEYTQNLLRREGANVTVLRDGTYDDAIAATQEDAKDTGALLVMDTSWDGYVEVPQWVTEGYRTMLTEMDRQVIDLTGGKTVNTFFVSVGVGSWAHSVVSHYKTADQENQIFAVEPDTAASFKESLHCDRIVPIQTGNTIMAGMNCGTTSNIAWPILRDGICAALTVTDAESHRDVEFLQSQKINVGPCGAAPLAALRKFVREISKEQRKGMTVVLFSTEGWRQYETPK